MHLFPSAVAASILISVLNPAPLWEVPAGAPPKSSPLVSNLSGRGLCVFIPLGDRGLGGWNGSGEALPGFPLSVSEGVSFRPASFRSGIHGTPVLCYVDDTGTLHLVDSSGNELPGWPVNLGSSPVTGVSALDLDSDGEREIATGTTDGRIHLMDERGVAVPGWPQSPGGRLEWTPAQVTLGSGAAGVVCALSTATVAVYGRSGNLQPGWPVNTGSSVSVAPVSADLDADGMSDIIFATGDRRVHALSLRGGKLPGWPYLLDSRPIRGTLAIGVVEEASGRLQVALATEASLVYLLDGDGTLAGAWRWPVPATGKPTCPLVLSTWDRNTVLAATDNGSVLTWDADGSRLEDRSFTHPEGVLFAPAAGDVDGNGITDLIVVGAGGLIAAYPIGSGRPGPWPMTFADAANSGSYGLGSMPTLRIADIAGRLSGDIPVSFQTGGGLVTGLEVAWSIDAGLTWNQTDNYRETDGGIVWRSRDDLGSADEPNVRLRLTPRSASGPGMAGISNIFRVDGNNPPELHLTTPEELPGGVFRINYAVEDDENDVLTIQAQYSTDGGASWIDARLSGSTVEIDPWLYGEPVEWDASEIAASAGPDGLSFRMRALDADAGEWSVIDGFGGGASGRYAGQILAPDYEVSGRVRLGLRLPGVSDPLIQASYEFSLDDGTTWSRATVSAPGDFDLRLYENEVMWESAIDAPAADTRSARFRAVLDGGRTVSVPSAAFHLDNDEPPTITVTSPGARSVHRGSVPVVVSVEDREGGPIMLGVQYRLLGDDRWIDAAGIMDNGPVGPDRYRSTLVWNSAADLPGAGETEIEFRAFASDGDTTYSQTVSPVAIVNNRLPSVIQAFATVDPETGRVPVRYELSDPEGRALSVELSYSLDGGLTWRRATTDGGTAESGGASGMITWFSTSDIGGSSARVLLRLTPFASSRTGPPRLLEVNMGR